MTSEQSVNGNGRPTWQDIRSVEAALRVEWEGDLRALRVEWSDDVKRIEKQIDEAIQRDRERCAASLTAMMEDVKALKAHQRETEQFHDRLRGAWMLIVFLIGSNLALVLLTLLGLVVALR